MATLTKDDVWKMIQILMSVTIIPLAGWVWNTNVKVAELQNDLGDAEEVIASLEKTKVKPKINIIFVVFIIIFLSYI